MTDRFPKLVCLFCGVASLEKRASKRGLSVVIPLDSVQEASVDLLVVLTTADSLILDSEEALTASSDESSDLDA